MAPPRYPLQSDVFYDFYWTVYMDLCFVMELEQEATRLGQPLTRQSITSIQRAMVHVNSEFEMGFTEPYCIKRFSKLEDRYRTFGEIISMPEVNYDVDTNVIHTEPEIWDKICMDKELGVAYRFQGDPCWDYLKRIFGDHQANSFSDCRHVINISSDDSQSRPPVSRNGSTSQTAHSATPTRRNGRTSRTSSTGPSRFSTSDKKIRSLSDAAGDDFPSSQASCSWNDVSKEL